MKKKKPNISTFFECIYAMRNDTHFFFLQCNYAETKVIMLDKIRKRKNMKRSKNQIKFDNAVKLALGSLMSFIIYNQFYVGISSSPVDEFP